MFRSPSGHDFKWIHPRYHLSKSKCIQVISGIHIFIYIDKSLNLNHSRTKYSNHDRKIMENLGTFLRHPNNDWADVKRAVQENCPMCMRVYFADEDLVIHAASKHQFLKIGQYLKKYLDISWYNKLSFTLVPSSSSFFVHANPS